MGPSGRHPIGALLAVLFGFAQPTAAGSDGFRAKTYGKCLKSWRERSPQALRHFQGYSLFAALTARQQLEMIDPLEPRAFDQGARRADEMLTLLGLGKKPAFAL